MKKALVLSGGGSRGAAQVGAIMALEEKGYKPDIIIGTSIGAIVGASYLFEGSAKKLVQTSLKISEKRLKWFSLKNRRNKKGFIIEKILNHIILKKKGFIKPFIFYKAIDSYFKNITFSYLKDRFFCISTDLKTGEDVIHKSGKLASALKASITITGVFPPYKQTENMLLDGGTTNVVPCDIAKKLGAEHIIAIDIKNNKIKGKYNTSNNLMDLENEIICKTIDKYKKSLTDIYIEPLKDSVETLDFTKTRELIKEGYEYVMKISLPRDLIL